MNVKFGQFLINNGEITEDQLNTALSLQLEEHYKLGQLACFSGKIDENQVSLILKAMTEEVYAGRKFGEVAMALDFISKGDLEEIVNLEDEVNIRIGEILVMAGYVTQDEFDKYYKEFTG